MSDAPTKHLPGPLKNPVATIGCGPPKNHAQPLEKQSEEDLPGMGSYVYAVVSNKPFQRLSGESSVLYVGKGTADRVRSLWKGGHTALPALYRAHKALKADCYWVVAAGGDTQREASLAETAVLTKLARAHGELPPCNSRWEGYILGRYLRAIAEHCKEDEERILVYDWPQENPTATWIDVEAGRWCWSLAWVWTAPNWRTHLEKEEKKYSGLVPKQALGGHDVGPSA